MRFIELTGIDGTPVILNPMQIVAIVPHTFEFERTEKRKVYDELLQTTHTMSRKVKDTQKGTQIYVVGDEQIFNVKEDYKAIWDMAGGGT